MDIAGMLKQLRAERDLLDQAINHLSSLADTRKPGTTRPKVVTRRDEQRPEGRAPKVRGANSK